MFIMNESRVYPFLSFTGKAEEAMKFYSENLPETNIGEIVRYGKNHPMVGEGEENFILHGSLLMMGQKIMFMDMPTAYPAPEFSWSTSLYIDCVSEVEFDDVFSSLSKNGTVMMGPESVGHIRKCAWVTDKFGVTWQPVWI
jgi:predicted 3-demethylubiquinone-9 3-methyltransferase (glyoxalase superfamily)